MRRRRTLFWTIIGGVAAAVALVIVVIQVNSGTPSTAASTSVPPVSTGGSSQGGESAPVVTPETSSTSSYLSDLTPSGDLAGSVTPGPVKIAGSVYPKSISFYCNVGDPTAFPVYKLKHHARWFQATIGLPAYASPQFKAAILLVSDGHTLRTVNVSVPKPKTVDVDVQGVRALQLECFGAGNSATGGEAVPVAWGNARFSGGH
jgi:NPCBM/NEW2 domain